MKTDHIFYRIFKELPQTFFELWGESPELVNDYRLTTPLGVQIIQLVVATKKQLLERVTRLIAQVKQQFADEPYRLQLLNLLEVIVLAKLPQMSRQELEAMFGVEDLRNTRFAQELIEEGAKIGEERGEIKVKLQTIPRLLGKGFSVIKPKQLIFPNKLLIWNYQNQKFGKLFNH